MPLLAVGNSSLAGLVAWIGAVGVCETAEPS